MLQPHTTPRARGAEEPPGGASGASGAHCRAEPRALLGSDGPRLCSGGADVTCVTGPFEGSSHDPQGAAEPAGDRPSVCVASASTCEGLQRVCPGARRGAGTRCWRPPSSGSLCGSCCRAGGGSGENRVVSTRSVTLPERVFLCRHVFKFSRADTA